MTDTDEGFVKVQFNGTWLGQQTVNAFYYGFSVGEAPTTFTLAEGVADDIVTELNTNPSTAPGYAAWRLPFAVGYVLTGCDVWVKGTLGVELAVRPVALSITGARGTFGESIPANVTASVYAPANRYAQRGAKLGFSGGQEPDVDSSGWIATAGLFKANIQTFCNTMYQSGAWNVGVGGITLIPAVVPRIRTGSPGAYTYRLPIETGDVPQAVSISAWSVGQGTGTANSRKNPIR